ncbi:MAG TPA: twin-arginine translocation pathway signal, partial [Flavilitoribacter sp.]|nr:twin-arginine translocation pathway signal [Flavilitoribacter sp.]
MKRRSFIKHSALASTAMMAPAFLQGFSPAGRYSSRAGKVLVVVQFSGGNDGLNTVIPYSNDLYYNLRPNLA